MPGNVTMTCMTTKKKFEVENPTVVKLQNGRYAYRCECPWKGKNDKILVAFKFCSAVAWKEQCEREGTCSESEHNGSESEHSGSEGEHH